MPSITNKISKNIKFKSNFYSKYIFTKKVYTIVSIKYNLKPSEIDKKKEKDLG